MGKRQRRIARRARAIAPSAHGSLRIAIASDERSASTRVVVCDEAGRVIVEQVGPYVPPEEMPVFAEELQRSFARAPGRGTR